MKIRRRKHDIVFSRLVRARDKRCQRCETDQNLDCAHIMSRRHVGLRWHPRNAMALCRACHFYFTGAPFDFVEFCQGKFGEGLIDELRRVASISVHWTPAQKEEIYRAMLEYTEGEDFPAHQYMHQFRC